jgi:hypothetical protein
MSIFETLSILLAIISVSALFWQIQVALHTMRADHERRKKQATIEFLMSQVRPLWTEGKRMLDAKWGTSVLSEDALNEIQEDSNAREIVTNLLGHLEYLSVGINAKIYDKDILYRASGTYLIRLFYRLRPYIKLAQRDLPTIYIEFEALIQDFEERKLVKPPKEGNIVLS